MRRGGGGVSWVWSMVSHRNGSVSPILWESKFKVERKMGRLFSLCKRGAVWTPDSVQLRENILQSENDSGRLGEEYAFFFCVRKEWGFVVSSGLFGWSVIR